MYALLVLSLLSISLQEPQDLGEDLSTAEREFGLVGSFIQDIDGDGTQDLLVGSNAEIYAVSWKEQRILFSIPFEAGPPCWRLAGPCTDLNGDGFRDILISTGERQTYDITLTAHDGRNGSIIRTFVGMQGMDARDLEGDGDVEILVGMRGPSDCWIGLVDADSGDFIHRWPIGAAHKMSLSACITDDLDGDSVADIAYVRMEGPGQVFLTCRSGATGEVLRTWRVAREASVESGPRDIDGDGVCDLLVSGGELVSGGGQDVRIYSGRTGSSLRWLSEQPEDRGWWGSGFGGSALFVDDFDGDGVADVAVQMRDYRAGDGALAVHSGKTGKRIFRIEAPGDHEHFGTPRGTADVNDDGKQDLLVLANSWESVSPGRLYLIDGASREVLWSLDWKTVSAWPAK